VSSALPASSAHRRILVVEDVYMIADDLTRMLEDLEVVVIDPVSTLEAALRVLDAAPILDGAILHIDLRREKSFPIADALQARGIPFVLVTSYDTGVIPEAYQAVPRLEKPVDMQEVVQFWIEQPGVSAEQAIWMIAFLTWLRVLQSKGG
jgi:DNA-binding NtrC family response regulator